MTSSMTTPSFDSIKLTLVDGEWSAPGIPVSTVTPDELVIHLIHALEYADPTFCQHIEKTLLRLGHKATPHLLQGLLSANTQVKSTCAMVLIRLGHTVVPQLETFYSRYGRRKESRWVLEFVFEQLSVTPPALSFDDIAWISVPNQPDAEKATAAV